MQKTDVKRAAIYVKETARPGQGGADAETQMVQAQAHCRTMNLEVVAKYHDGQDSREQFQQMMADASGKPPPFDNVVVWKRRFFSWDLEEAIQERDKLTANGVRLLSVKERAPGE